MTKSDWSREPWRLWYGSQRWKKLRRLQLKAHPLCCLCLARGHVVVATVVDHVEPHHGDWNQFLTGELQSLCRECHESTKGFVEAHGYYPDIGLDGWPVDPRHPSNRKGR